MIIYPAIDLRGGKVVRLRQGDPAAQTVFGEDPAEAARRWAGQGAAWLHVVNLDGALVPASGASTGEPNPGVALNLQRLAEIRAAVELPIQFGGGIRSLEAVESALVAGATRVVLGTAAVREPEMVAEAVRRFGAERIVAGIDARGGQVAVAGWQEAAGVEALELARRMRTLGVIRAVYTDIARDGMLSGANVAATAALARESGLQLIASGGVTSLDDIRALAKHAADGVEGAIIGQALYSGAIELAEALRVARGAG
jgi:phosphoribosylformimino-5-aminoimidazole carboxamide ribotide isomerase